MTKDDNSRRGEGIYPVQRRKLLMAYIFMFPISQYNFSIDRSRPTDTFPLPRLPVSYGLKPFVPTEQTTKSSSRNYYTTALNVTLSFLVLILPLSLEWSKLGNGTRMFTERVSMSTCLLKVEDISLVESVLPNTTDWDVRTHAEKRDSHLNLQTLYVLLLLFSCCPLPFLSTLQCVKSHDSRKWKERKTPRQGICSRLFT